MIFGYIWPISSWFNWHNQPFLSNASQKSGSKRKNEQLCFQSARRWNDIPACLWNLCFLRVFELNTNFITNTSNICIIVSQKLDQALSGNFESCNGSIRACFLPFLAIEIIIWRFVFFQIFKLDTNDNSNSTLVYICVTKYNILSQSDILRLVTAPFKLFLPSSASYSPHGDYFRNILCLSEKPCKHKKGYLIVV